MESRNQNFSEDSASILKVTIYATWKSRVMEREPKGSNHISFELKGCQGKEQV